MTVLNSRSPFPVPRSPLTGEPLGEHPVDGPEEVRAAVGRAREAARAWAARGWTGRRARLLAWKRSLARRLPELAESISAETGKPPHDARTEVLLTLVHLDWLARRVAAVCAERLTPLLAECGPVVAVNAVRDLDEAVARANASDYALDAAVFTGDRRTGPALAQRLDSGAVSVNSVLGFAAVPARPFGGSGASSHGRIHGAEGLRAFTAPQALTVRRFRPPVDLTSFTTPGRRTTHAIEAGRWLHSRR